MTDKQLLDSPKAALAFGLGLLALMWRLIRYIDRSFDVDTGRPTVRLDNGKTRELTRWL